MLLKVLTPAGLLRTVEDVVPIIEERRTFNGQKRRIVEVCSDRAEPNGVTLLCKNNMNYMPCQCSRELTIGNLKSEAVREIMRKLLSDGYYDFSQIEYQARVDTVDETELDNGEGLSYTSDRIRCYCETGVFNFTFPQDPFSSTCFSVEAAEEDDEDNSFDEDSDEEE